MPTPPFAQVQASVNGGANASGFVSAAFGQTVQLSATNTTGWTAAVWSIYDYPPNFSFPIGWSNVNGVCTFAPANPTTLPPLITLPSTGANNWGPFMIRLQINGNPLNRNADGSPNTAFNPSFTDESTIIDIASPTAGMVGVGFNMTTQYDTLRSWCGAFMQAMRVIDPLLSGGSPGGDVSGTIGAMVVNQSSNSSQFKLTHGVPIWWGPATTTGVSGNVPASGLFMRWPYPGSGTQDLVTGYASDNTTVNRYVSANVASSNLMFGGQSTTSADWNNVTLQGGVNAAVSTASASGQAGCIATGASGLAYLQGAQVSFYNAAGSSERVRMTQTELQLRLGQPLWFGPATATGTLGNVPSSGIFMRWPYPGTTSTWDLITGYWTDSTFVLRYLSANYGSAVAGGALYFGGQSTTSPDWGSVILQGGINCFVSSAYTTGSAGCAATGTSGLAYLQAPTCGIYAANGSTLFAQFNATAMYLGANGSTPNTCFAPGEQPFTPSNGANSLSAALSYCTMLNLVAGASATVTITSATAASTRQMVVVRNNTSQTVNWGWATGSTVSLATLTSALITSDGTNALIMMKGT